VFHNIDKLVGEQVNKVYIKRLKDKHPKGYDIKVCLNDEAYDRDRCLN